jgi:hypothetical protein
MKQDTGRVRSALPADAPLLSLRDVAAYLRLSLAAVRKLLDGRADGSDGEMGDVLRRCCVRLSPHRRYIRRDLFMTWLRDKLGPTDEAA